MKIFEEKRNIVTVCYRQEQDDPDYGTCIWADFYFDTYAYQLTIASDCGNYTYGWNATPKEDFLRLMARMHKEYLLDKIAEENVVCADETAEELFEYISALQDDEPPTLDFQRVTEDDIKEIVQDYSGDSISLLIEKVCYLLNERDISHDYSEISECIVTRYSADATKIGEVFEQHVQPYIREMIKERDGEEISE
jgi:hypothetical protein